MAKSRDDLERSRHDLERSRHDLGHIFSQIMHGTMIFKVNCVYLCFAKKTTVDMIEICQMYFTV